MKDSKFRVRQHILCFASISRKRTPRRRFESLATLSNRLSPRCQVSAGDFLFSYSKHSITAVATTHTSSSSFHKHFHITCLHHHVVVFYFDEILFTSYSKFQVEEPLKHKTVCISRIVFVRILFYGGSRVLLIILNLFQKVIDE